MRIFIVLVAAMTVVSCSSVPEIRPNQPLRFDPSKDLLSLHYDHSPDKDDGHSAAADRTILQSLFGKEWISHHVLAVSGAYGINGNEFDPDSDLVMDAAWNDCGGWLSAHTDRDGVVNHLFESYRRVIIAGGNIWIKEGGPSDLTAAVLDRLIEKFPGTTLSDHIHVVQHSPWNEEHTTKTALSLIRQTTNYIRIEDANTLLRRKGDLEEFIQAALVHPDVAHVWETAFAYYNPLKEYLDFSDTSELMYILNIGILDIDDFRRRFLEKE